MKVRVAVTSWKMTHSRFVFLDLRFLCEHREDIKQKRDTMRVRGWGLEIGDWGLRS